MSETGVPPARILWRGVRKKCARCGGGDLFRHWFTMAEDCPHCGLHFEREQGYFVGAVVVNMMIVGALFAIVLIVFSVMTAPDIPWVTLLLLELPIVIIGPMLLYPFTKTIWVAVDRAFLARLS